MRLVVFSADILHFAVPVADSSKGLSALLQPSLGVPPQQWGWYIHGVGPECGGTSTFPGKEDGRWDVGVAVTTVTLPLGAGARSRPCHPLLRNADTRYHNLALYQSGFFAFGTVDASLNIFLTPGRFLLPQPPAVWP